MHKVISLSIFDNPKNAYRPGFYWQHLRHSIWGYLSLFPDWEIRIYHDKSLYNNYYGGVILNLQTKGLVKLIYMGEEPAICKAMLWRLNPVFDKDVTYVLCRDTDHSPTIRERTMAEQFMATGLALHCIQDNPAHSVPMMGGLISFDASKTRKILKVGSLDNLLVTHSWGSDKLMEHGTDQDFLQECVWPRLKNSSCMHSVREDISLETKIMPSVPLCAEIDTCIPFMGTNSCNFPKWYDELRKIGYAENIQEIEVAEARSMATDCFSHLNLEFACTNSRRVVLATDGNPNYYFFIPIVSMLWQYYIGYCPVVIIIGTLREWISAPQTRLAIEEARKMGAEIHFISEIDGYRTSSVAQNSRLYISCLPMYHDGMYMVLSDMDMLPLNRAWFNKQDMSKRVHLDYANVYRHKQYPLCYVGCDVGTWKEIMKPSHPDNIIESIKSQFEADGLKSETDGMKVWCYDETMFGKKIKAWPGYRKDCQMFNRKGCPPVDRIDRSCWPETFDIQEMVDCHSIRPGHTDDANWLKVKSVLAKVVSKEDLLWAENYRMNFCKVKG